MSSGRYTGVYSELTSALDAQISVLPSFAVAVRHSVVLRGRLSNCGDGSTPGPFALAASTSCFCDACPHDAGATFRYLMPRAQFWSRPAQACVTQFRAGGIFCTSRFSQSTVPARVQAEVSRGRLVHRTLADAWGLTFLGLLYFYF